MNTKQMPPGNSLREFVRLAGLETDDHVVWPYAKSGQRQYGLFYDEHGRKRYCHREALRRRVPQPDEFRRYVLHGLGCPSACLNYRHLRWGTMHDNNMDKHRDGTATAGERSPMARLTEVVVAEIRSRYAAGGVTQRQLADEYGVTVMTVNRAVRGQSWTR